MFLQVSVCPQGGICLSACWETPQGDPLPRRPPCQRDPTARETPCQGDSPSRPKPRGEIEGAKVMFLQVCLSTGGLPQCMLGDPQGDPHQGDPLPRRTPCQGDPPTKETPARETPLPGRPPTKETSLPRRPPSRPTPRGEIEGHQVQAHSQGGNSGGIRSRPIPKGEIQGDQDQTPLNNYCCGQYTSYWNAFLFLEKTI